MLNPQLLVVAPQLHVVGLREAFPEAVLEAGQCGDELVGGLLRRSSRGEKMASTPHANFVVLMSSKESVSCYHHGLDRAHGVGPAVGELVGAAAARSEVRQLPHADVVAH
ncbi:hypothetical protein GOP47_0021037 [Adiantum capillus-veneris]|uniref:Uncharacterized protein n=1 Tax=Adiantum capillus-veneris TaxID=13818 RepID=A0A9D4UAQ3_ADICA|nr:hypothetical protein GOP47_0021037 [Adiantum capillus-veneris]